MLSRPSGATARSCRRCVSKTPVRLARTDPLTGEADRGFFIDEVQRAIAASRPSVVWLVGLDDFKAVDDVYGHAAGDAVLRATIERVKAVVGPSALIARLGGDESAVLIGTGAWPPGPHRFWKPRVRG